MSLADGCCTMLHHFLGVVVRSTRIPQFFSIYQVHLVGKLVKKDNHPSAMGTGLVASGTASERIVADSSYGIRVRAIGVETSVREHRNGTCGTLGSVGIRTRTRPRGWIAQFDRYMTHSIRGRSLPCIEPSRTVVLVSEQ